MTLEPILLETLSNLETSLILQCTIDRYMVVSDQVVCHSQNLHQTEFRKLLSMQQ